MARISYRDILDCVFAKPNINVQKLGLTQVRILLKVYLEVEPSIAGPKRPQDKIFLKHAPESFKSTVKVESIKKNSNHTRTQVVSFFCVSCLCCKLFFENTSTQGPSSPILLFEMLHNNPHHCQCLDCDRSLQPCHQENDMM